MSLVDLLHSNYKLTETSYKQIIGEYMGRKRKTYLEIVSEMQTEDRISEAKICIKKLTYSVGEVLEMHESNQIIVYSDILSSQIPSSFAGHSFKDFQAAMYRYEIVRLLALWDSAQANAYSIPKAVMLIDGIGVLEALKKSAYETHANARAFRVGQREDTDEDEAELDKLIKNTQTERGIEYAKKTELGLLETIKEANRTGASDKLKSIRNVRDHISHSLEKTRRELSVDITPMKYGDEKALLSDTIKYIEDLYCFVNGTSFSIEDEGRESAKRNATELWENCKFSIPNHLGGRKK
jgi:hypothetical protein